MNNDNGSLNCDTSTVEEPMTGVKNSFQIKQGPYQSRCPNCGYCPNCGRSNNGYPYWYNGNHTTTTAAPLNTDGTTWNKNFLNDLNKSYGTANGLGQQTISFIDISGAKAH